MNRRTFFLACCLPAAAVRAQNLVTPVVPATLSGLLPATRWIPGAAKTLVVIGGRQTQALPEAGYGIDDSMYRAYYARLRQETLSQLGPMPSGGYALGAVAAAVGRKVARYGGIATLVPTTKKTLVASPGTPRRTGQEPATVGELIDRLDDASLKKLMSESGLGRDELPEPLQAVFETLLPPSQGISGDKERPFVPLERYSPESPAAGLSDVGCNRIPGREIPGATGLSRKGRAARKCFSPTRSSAFQVTWYRVDA